MASLPKSSLLGLLAAAPVLGNDPNMKWFPPSSSQVNDLDKVLNGKGTWGFIYDSSHTSDDKYGTYNWCNMPHARKREYKKASKEYELQYVEVVSSVLCSDMIRRLTFIRFKDITSVLHTQQTLSQLNHTSGTAIIKASTISAANLLNLPNPTPKVTGKDSPPKSTPSSLPDGSDPANFLKSQPKVSMILGSTEKTSTKSTTIF